MSLRMTLVLILSISRHLKRPWYYWNNGRYDNGVTNNGATSGIIAFDVPFNAPDKLSYQCSAHAAMGGTIFLTGGDTSTLVDFDAGINVTGVSTFQIK